MAVVTIIVVLALVQYTAFGAFVGQARDTYDVPAPAITGHPVFERYQRVHQNTLELLIVFIPGLVSFAHYLRPDLSCGLGVAYLVGRILYFRAYVADPQKRRYGYMLSFFSSWLLVFGGLLGAILELWSSL